MARFRPYDDLYDPDYPEDDHSHLSEASPGEIEALFQTITDARDRGEVIGETVGLMPAEGRMFELLADVPQIKAWKPFTKHEIESLTEMIGAYNSCPAEDRVARAFDVNRNVARLANRRTDVIPESVRTQADQAVLDAVDRIRLLDRADSAAVEAESTAARIARLEQDAREATGDTGMYSLSEHYSSEAFDQEESANIYRVIAIAIAVIGAGLVILLPLGEEVSGPELVRRISIAVTTLGLAGYFGREAAQHRHVSRELKTAQIRLSTIPAYAAGLDRDQRGPFLEKVGTVLFTTPTPHPGEKKSTGSEAETEQLLQRLTDLVKAAGLPRN